MKKKSKNTPCICSEVLGSLVLVEDSDTHTAFETPLSLSQHGPLAIDSVGLKISPRVWAPLLQELLGQPAIEESAPVPRSGMWSFSSRLKLDTTYNRSWGLQRTKETRRNSMRWRMIEKKICHKQSKQHENSLGECPYRNWKVSWISCCQWPRDMFHSIFQHHTQLKLLLQLSMQY